MPESISQPETVNRLTASVDAGFALLAGMQLDLFTPLKMGPMTAEQLAIAIGVSSRQLRLLLYVLVVAGLLIERDGHFSNTAEASQFLVSGEPSYIGNRHGILGMRWREYFKTAESIRSGVPKAKVDFSNAAPEELEKFLRNVNANTVQAARGLVQAADFSSVKTLLDVGCGGAGMAITITNACPHVSATAMDLPQVAPIARKIVSEEGAEARVKVLAADAVNGPLSGAYDAAILRAFLQVLSPEDSRRAIHNVGAVLNPGGRIFIIGQILDDSRRSPLDAVGFNLTFINFFDAGESYTESEHQAWLSAAGFVDIQRSSRLLPDGNSLMTARKAN
jgi:cyclopropane fatty-acyl-phospholipid synthase-like methyltransferase